jgi:hypothetical protein
MCKPVTITFDKRYKQRIYQMVEHSIKNKRCVFCDRFVSAKNFAGAGVFDNSGKNRFWCGCIEGIIALADRAEIDM